MDDQSMGAPARLRRWREEHGVPQREIAAACGADTATVSRWERGHATPTLRAAVVLERRTGIPAAAWAAGVES